MSAVEKWHDGNTTLPKFKTLAKLIYKLKLEINKRTAALLAPYQ